MTLTELAILLAVAGICGAIGQSLSGVSRGGCLASIALGFIGAFLGRWIAGVLKLPSLLTIDVGEAGAFPIVWSIVGAAIFVAILSFFTRPRGRRT